MSDTLGGYCFYNEKFDGPCQKEVLDEKGNVVDIIQTTEPRYVDQGEVTQKVFEDSEAKILEINSKTGLYPLYVAYSLYRRRRKDFEDIGLIEEQSVEEEQVVWDDIIRNNVYVICNTPMAVRITQRTLFGFREDAEGKANIKSRNLIQEATTNPEELVKIIKSVGFWQGTTSKQQMEFSAIVGNPPYQEMKGSQTNNTAFASAVYPYFIDLGIKIKSNYLSLITPSRWMTKTGQGIPDSWVDEMIKCNHFLRIHDFHDASECFRGVEIKGGVSYFLYDKNHIGKCDYSITANGETNSYCDYLDSTKAGIIIRDGIAKSIIEKIAKIEGDYYNGTSFSSLVGPVHFFDKDGILGTKWSNFVTNKDDEHPIKYYLNKRLVPSGQAWIKENDIPKGFEAIPLHKVYISEAYGAGETFPHQILGVPFYGEPNSVCSETYLCIGYNPTNNNFTKEICENIISYIRTKFFRYLVFVKKKTQHAPASVYQFVPLQDFTKQWTDEELFNRYCLDIFERDYIDSMIKTME